MDTRLPDIRSIEVARLHELQKQAAYKGPHTDPAILIEIQELVNKYPDQRGDTRKVFVASLDYDFLMNAVSAALIRLTQLEQRYEKDARARWVRQLVHDVWMIAITCIVVASLLLLLSNH